MNKTWDVSTNLAYVACGVVALQVVASPIGFVFGLAMIALGVASALFHSGTVKWGNHADVMTIYVVGTILLVSAFGVSGAIGAVVALIGGLGLGWFLRWEVKEPMERKVGALFLAVLVATSIRSIYSEATWWLIGVGSVLLLVALWARFLWTIPNPRDLIPVNTPGVKPWRLPHPKSHGAWHLVSAPGLLLWFLGTVA